MEIHVTALWTDFETILPKEMKNWYERKILPNFELEQRTLIMKTFPKTKIFPKSVKSVYEDLGMRSGQKMALWSSRERIVPFYIFPHQEE